MDEPELHDYDAAEQYLSLVISNAKDIVQKLRRGKMTSFKAKDILRASMLPALGAENLHVAKDMRKPELSPILLVRGHERLHIADGYHRVCAVYLMDEDAEIPCKFASI